jgi:hypothetical protein
VLAAASLTQSIDVEETVREYLKTLPFYDDVDLTFDYSVTLNVRNINVRATYQMPTSFLPLINIETLPVAALATARERRGNVEISLVLDISGSMREGSPTKIGLLRPAAKNFIDALITSETSARTSMSIVPYAGSVNPGAVVMDALGVPRRHNYSSCVEFTNNDYGVGLIPFNQRTQLPHFTYNHQNTPYSGRNQRGVPYTGVAWSWCPEEQTSVMYLSNDATALKARIDALQMHDGTGTAIAMNWGMMLLEPGARPMVSLAAQHGMVPRQFANRPADFTDPNTLKVLVLMTDGEMGDQYRPKQYDYPRSCNGPSNGSQADRCTTIYQSRSVALQRMYAVCDRAKRNNVVVYTIGFDLSDSITAQRNMKAELRSCASSSSHYYDVQGLDINAAFQNIAAGIDRVRLTQ